MTDTAGTDGMPEQDASQDAQPGASPTDAAIGGLADAIRRRLGECTPAERKVARVLLAAYPSAGFDTVARIAERAGVSAPTVVRFAHRLGYRGFPDFQRALRTELEERNASPLALYHSTGFAGTADSPAETLLHNSSQSLTTAVQDTCKTLPPHDLQRAVDLLADGKRRVLLAGGRFTELHARYLGLHLHQIREDVCLLPRRTVERSALLASAGRRDVLVVYDFRRYEPETLSLARLVAAAGGKVVLCTDVWLSPVSAVADVVLPCQVGGPSPYDSLVPALAVTEIVVTGVLCALGETARTRMQAVEDAARAAGLQA